MRMPRPAVVTAKSWTLEIEWCANCGDHALAHYEEPDEDGEWVEQRPGCPGWVLGHTTRSEGSE